MTVACSVRNISTDIEFIYVYGKSMKYTYKED